MELRIIKVPHGRRDESVRPNFPIFKTKLFLDLIENKKKLKSGVPKDFDHKNEARVSYDRVQKSKDDSTSNGTHGDSIFEEDDERGEDRGRDHSETNGYHHDDREDRDDRRREDRDDRDHSARRESSRRRDHDDDRDHSARRDSRRRTENRDPNAPTRESVAENMPQMSAEDELEMYINKLSIMEMRNPDKKFLFANKYNEFSDLNTVRREYRRISKYLAINNNATFYESILGFGFTGLEYAALFFGFNAKDYAAEQIKQMANYRDMLIELGEKGSGFQGLPVEVRLLGLMIINLVVYCFTNNAVNRANAAPKKMSGLDDLDIDELLDRKHHAA